MSALSCATFLLILLACLENACSARPGVFNATGAMVQDEDPSDNPNLIKKKDGLKINLTDAQGTAMHQAASSTVRKSSHTKDSSNKEEEEAYVMTTRNRRHKHSSRKKKTHQGGGIKVTYTVSQKSDEDQQQSFTLDYSPPKVHPPHHN